MNPYSLAADLLVIVHSLYVLFTVGGTLVILLSAPLHWRWARNRTFRIIHLISVLFVALEASLGMLCPLTVWEYELRKLSGHQVESDISFIGRLLRKIIFVDLPGWAFLILYTAFGAIVLILLFVIKPEKPDKPDKKDEVD